jgi:dihydrofolate reductase / thymidylate synthase
MTAYVGEQGYLNLLRETLNSGECRQSRNGIVYSSFAKLISFEDIGTNFPLLTSKKIFVRGIVEELLWFLSGSTNANKLEEKNVHIWSGNSSREYLDSVGLKDYEEGELGPIYGWQWRSFGKSYKTKNGDEKGIDQIKYIIEELSKPNNSRRVVLSAWNPLQLNEMALPPCHMTYTFYKNNKGLSCMMNMRSSDLFLGLPFNIASTAFLTCIIAKVLHIEPCDVSIVITDAHIYEEHKDAVNKQLNNDTQDHPVVKISKSPPQKESTVDEKLQWIEELKYEDFEIINYKSSGSISAQMK